ncbi:hypothetical protein EDD37DRAFT_103745 [Exophiala viscosa]|uniref:uncharacterized protein n=1 Tax=Exophiala viscosa TaxID=2486360 RepID=UPI00218D9AF7|nr:hypothetical protein EDD37DRAFT_103745 [Exophiala viscosa]
MPHPRKKLRRAVNSCGECRRRKIRCDLNTISSEVCSNCASRNIACESWQDHDGSTESNDPSLLARLQRVESLLDGLTHTDDSELIERTPLPAGSVSTPIEGDDNPPVISLFDNAIFRRHEKASPSHGLEDSATLKSTHSPTDATSEKLRLTLVNLLPCQEDAELVAASTNGWGLRQVLCTPVDGLFRDATDSAAFDIAAVSRDKAVVVARTLLYLAVCLQQLPPGYDWSNFHFKCSVDTVLHKYLTTVADLVTCKDDLACTLEGVECLLLQSLFYINDGNLRRAWLAGRRALNIAQFLGIHKRFLRIVRQADSQKRNKASIMMWLKIVMVDRYLALVLGFPCGVGEDCFGEEEDLLKPVEDLHDVFERRLCIVSGMIAKRNSKELPPSYTATLDIDEHLDKLAKDMPQTWFSVPTFSTARGSSANIKEYEMMMNQIWFFQLTQMLHLPFMLRAFTESRYEYSKITCINASRELLLRYLALRGTNNTQLHARVVDFATVIAGVVLILNHVGSTRSANKDISNQTEDDINLVQRVLESMRIVGRGERDIMARQGAELMEALLAIDADAPGTHPRRNIRLTVPFIGTVAISSAPAADVTEPQATGSQLQLPVHVQPEHDVALGYSTSIFAPHNLSFEQANIPDPSWFPPVEAWDLDNLNSDPTSSNPYSFWNFSG